MKKIFSNCSLLCTYIIILIQNNGVTLSFFLSLIFIQNFFNGVFKHSIHIIWIVIIKDWNSSRKRTQYTVHYLTTIKNKRLGDHYHQHENYHVINRWPNRAKLIPLKQSWYTFIPSYPLITLITGITESFESENLG